MNHNEDSQMFCENCKVYSKYFWQFSASYKIIQRSRTQFSELKIQLSLPSTSPQLPLHWGDTAENTAKDLKHYFTWATKTDPRTFSFAPGDLQSHILLTNFLIVSMNLDKVSVLSQCLAFTQFFPNVSFFWSYLFVIWNVMVPNAST